MTAVRPDGDRVIVKVSGELDLDTSERFRSVLREALNRSVGGVDLDLEGVTFCDCSALNILLTLRHRALEQAKTIAIHPASAAVDRLLTLTGTQALFAGPSPDSQDAPAQHAHDTQTSEGADYDLRIEVAQLRRAMQTRPTIDLARGILMASFSLSSEEAWTVLVAASQNTNTKLHSLAGDLVTAVKGDALSDAVQEQLSSAVARVTSSPEATRGGAEDQDPAQAAN
ncbi:MULTISPECIES: anti-sigma factor antagonist [unclassified Streptomyces]|uniref:anti-sigma factor antagonist n=1 Tax=unclassified Streptomyces TaxID=2593676 RepID=UPI002366C422|nr:MULTISPECIES: anti-sigma factor antagonist [unclassified Streptomyces]MDF3140577.1 anti-sigma factor antagonist [Streptomyces sp. T21Q-yed]WDF44357.1 anti-sigma factor antagonist [Streptomyces sp. T12]